MEEARIEGKALVTTKIERAPRAIMIPDRTCRDTQQFLYSGIYPGRIFCPFWVPSQYIGGFTQGGFFPFKMSFLKL